MKCFSLWVIWQDGGSDPHTFFFPFKLLNTIHSEEVYLGVELDNLIDTLKHLTFDL